MVQDNKEQTDRDAPSSETKTHAISDDARLLVIYADLDAPGLETFRAELKPRRAEVLEIFPTYNVMTQALDGVRAPLEIVDKAVFNDFHPKVYDWQASLPGTRLDAGGTVQSTFVYTSTDTEDAVRELETHTLWSTRLVPSMQIRFGVIETLITALDDFSPDAVVIFGFPANLGWTVTLAERAARTKGVPLCDPAQLLEQDVADAYAAHVTERRMDARKRLEAFRAKTAQRETDRVERLHSRLCNAATRAKRANDRARTIAEQNVTRATSIMEADLTSDSLEKATALLNAIGTIDLSACRTLPMVEAIQSHQRELLGEAQAMKGELKDELKAARAKAAEAARQAQEEALAEKSRLRSLKRRLSRRKAEEAAEARIAERLAQREKALKEREQRAAKARAERDTALAKRAKKRVRSVSVNGPDYSGSQLERIERALRLDKERRERKLARKAARAAAKKESTA